MDLSKEEIIKEIESCPKDELIDLISKYYGYELKSSILGRIFEKLYVNEAGFSAEIQIDDLVKIHPAFRTKNGSTWNRTGQSYLGKKYNIIRGHASGNTGSITSVKCDGPLKNPRATEIRKDIWDQITKERCVILDISSSVECDHKDGMKDDWKVADPKTQKKEDFQPLCKTANMAKKTHCKKCKETGHRYDATQLGYSFSFLYGDENTESCVGCYWYDPKVFNRTISKNYKKED